MRSKSAFRHAPSLQACIFLSLRMITSGRNGPLFHANSRMARRAGPFFGLRAGIVRENDFVVIEAPDSTEIKQPATASTSISWLLGNTGPPSLKLRQPATTGKPSGDTNSYAVDLKGSAPQYLGSRSVTRFDSSAITP